MFGRNGDANLPPMAKGADGDPWEAQVLKKLIAHDWLNFTLHYLKWRYREGPTSSGMGYHDKVIEVIGVGSLTSTEHIFVELTFEPALEEMGIVAFDWQFNERWNEHHIAIPCLRVVHAGCRRPLAERNPRGFTRCRAVRSARRRDPLHVVISQGPTRRDNRQPRGSLRDLCVGAAASPAAGRLAEADRRERLEWTPRALAAAQGPDEALGSGTKVEVQPERRSICATAIG